MPEHSLPPRQRRSGGSMAKKSSGRRKRARKKPSKSNVKILAVIGAAIVSIIGVVIAVQRFAGPHLRISSADLGLTGIVGDSHKSIYGDFVDVINDLTGVLASIRDEQSAQAAIEKLGAIESSLHEIEHRAVRVEPIPEQELKEIEKAFENQVDLKSIQAEAERLKNSGLLDEELAWTVRFLGLDVAATGRMLKYGMAMLPEPRNEYETLARDYVELQRKTTRILAGVESAGDVPSAVEQFQDLVPKFEALAERKRQFGRVRQGPLTSADSRYRSYSTEGVTSTLLDILKSKHGESNDLRQAYADVSTAASQYNFALMKDGPGGGSAGNPPPGLSLRGNDPAGASHGDPNLAGRRAGGPRAFGPASRSGRSGAFSPPSLPPGESAQIVLRGGPFKSAGDLKGDAFFAAKDRQREAMKKYGERLDSLPDSQRRHSNLSGGKLTVQLLYAGDLQALADKIDFGTVAEVDAETRTIVVDMAEE